MEEIWKDCVGYEGLYQVSSLGNVRNKKKLIKQQLSVHGYNTVLFCKSGIKKPFRVHRLVAISFIPNLENKPQVNHKDGNKQNNTLVNLEWCNQSENQIHAYCLGLQGSGGDHYKSKKIINEITKEIFLCVKDAANSIGINESTLRNHLSGYTKNKTPLKYI